MTAVPTRALSTARLATGLTAATTIVALGVAAAVAAVANWQSDLVAPVSLVGLALIVALAVATMMQQRSLAREIERVSLGTVGDDAAGSGLARARFIADMSHDLRQPLHALGLFLDALDRRVTPGEGEKILARAREAASAMGRAFNALIDLIRIEADALVPEAERFAVDRLLTRLEQEWADSATSAGADLQLVQTHGEVVGDRRIVGYIVRTLMANAIDLAPGRMLLGTRRRAGTLWIEIHCASPGPIAAKWNILHAASPLASAGVSALELDLFVARRLAELMAVELRVVAKENRGVVFALALPVAAETTASPLHARAILFLTGDSARAAAATNALARAGAVVYCAANQRQAEHAARSNRIDLVVTDLDVDDASARVRAERLAPATPALANRKAPEDLVTAAAAMLKSSGLAVGAG